jgi:DNA invertase Pin-like site-specific DNA recombinase
MSDLIPAVEYVRMSTENQQLSIPFQQAAIRLHATQRGYEIIRTYEDAARSGLYLQGRDSLIRLLAEVQSGQADFKAILVYDVSRWGRFQDTDESAHYEFLCRKADVQVIYCAEPFPNDHGPMATVLKAIKRAMAAEYSRELSVKTFAAMARLTTQGYVHGGPTGYGLRRMLVDKAGNYKTVLETGEWKIERTDRTIIIPGPQREVDTVRRIYALFLEERRGATEIARLLNRENVSAADGSRWTQSRIRTLLKSERYVGRLVFNRTSTLLRQGQSRRGRINNGEAQWIRGQLPTAIISEDQFARVKALPCLRGLIYREDAELIRPLVRLLKKKGRLSVNLIKGQPDVPAPSTLRYRFGSVRKAFALAGYICRYNSDNLLGSRTLARDLLLELLSALNERGCPATWPNHCANAWFGNRQTLWVGVARTLQTYKPRQSCKTLAPRWFARTQRRTRVHPDFTVFARLNEAGKTVLDYYCVPASVITKTGLIFNQSHDQYRCQTLEEVVNTLLGGQ